MIHKTTDKYCKPRDSLPNVYEYKSNLHALEIHDILTKGRFIIKQQVQNYRNQIIAFIVITRQDDKMEMYIPTAPSAPVKNIPRIFPDMVVWQEYEVTRDRLTQIATKTSNQLLCKPAFKVIEDGLIVGIFTETNQFIQVSNPVENIIEDGIPEYHVHGYKDNQYYNADTAFATDSTNDSLRTKTVRNITLESQFYTLFRTKLRLVLADYRYKAIRDELIYMIENQQYLYKTKMKRIIQLIRQVLTPVVTFIEFDEDVLKQLNEMNAIIKPDEINKICMLKEDKLCVPNKHLVSGVENENLYYGRLADELIRYSRIRMFILDPKHFLSIGNVEYQVNDTEILYLHSLLLTNDIDKLVPMRKNKYIENIPREFAHPSLSNVSNTSTDVSLKQQYIDTPNASIDILKSACVSNSGPVLVSPQRWHTILHDDAIEHSLNISVQCSFYIIMYVMQERLQIRENIYEIKQRLVGYYTELLQTYFVKICDILEKQGKRQYVNMLKKKQIEVNTMIMNDNYNLTAIDMWIISMKLDLPIIIFSSNASLSFAPTLDWIRLGGNPETDSFYFIRMLTNTQYNLITPPSRLNDLNGFEQMIQSPLYSKKIQSFQEYMQSYEIIAPKLIIRKPRKMKPVDISK